MADKLRTTYPVEVVFTPGEQPSAEKLTAISTQAKTGMRIIENAIGDLWGTGGDAVFKGLQMPSLGRVVGENKYLNPALFSLQDTNGAGIPFYYIEKLDEVFDKKTTGYLTFKPYNNANYTSENGDDGFGFLVSNGSAQIIFSTTLTQGGTALKEEDIGIGNADKFFVDTDTGRFRFPTPFESGTHIYIGYWVNPDDWAFGKILGDDGNILPGVIPDPREVGSSTLSATPVSASVYDIKIPQRKPLNIDVHDMEQKIPQPCLFGSEDFNDESDTSTGGYGSSELPRIWSINESHTSHNPSFHRYTVPVFDALADGALFPEGTVKLVESVNNKTIHGLIFKRKDDSTIEVTDLHGFLESSVSNGEQFYLVSSGPSASKSVSILRQIVLNHSHDGKHQENKLTHSFFDGNAPAKNRDGMVWTHSNLDQDDHIQYLHRENGSSSEERDPNHNAMLDDLIISQKTLDAATGLYIGDLTTQDSNNIYFGIDAADSPQIGVAAPQLTNTLWAIPVSNPDYNVIDFSNLFVVDANSDRVEDPGRTLTIESGNNSSIVMDGLLTTINLPYRYLNFDSTPGAGTFEAEDYYDLITPKLLVTKPFGPTIVKLKGSPSVTGYKHGFESGGGNAILHLTGHEDTVAHNCGRLWWDGRNEKLKLQWFSNAPANFEGNYGFDGAGPTGDIDTSGWPSYTTQPTALEIWKKHTGLQSLIASSNPNNSQLYEDLEATQVLGFSDLQNNVARFEGQIEINELLQEYPSLLDSNHSTPTAAPTNTPGGFVSVEIGGVIFNKKVSYFLSLRIPTTTIGKWSWSEPVKISDQISSDGTSRTIQIDFKIPNNIYEYAIFREYLLVPGVVNHTVFLGRTYLSKEEMNGFLSTQGSQGYQSFGFEDFKGNLDTQERSSVFTGGLIPKHGNSVEWKTQYLLEAADINSISGSSTLETFPPTIANATNDTDHFGGPSHTEIGTSFRITKDGGLLTNQSIESQAGLSNQYPTGKIAATQLQLQEQEFEGFARQSSLSSLSDQIPNHTTKWTSYKANIKQVVSQKGLVFPIQYSGGTGGDKLKLFDENGDQVIDNDSDNFVYLGGPEWEGYTLAYPSPGIGLPEYIARLPTVQANITCGIGSPGIVVGSDWKSGRVRDGEISVFLASFVGEEDSLLAEINTDGPSGSAAQGVSAGLSGKTIIDVRPPIQFYTGPYRESFYDTVQEFYHQPHTYAFSYYFEYLGWEISPLRYFETPSPIQDMEDQEMGGQRTWKFTSNKFLKLIFRSKRDSTYLFGGNRLNGIVSGVDGFIWEDESSPGDEQATFPNNCPSYIQEQLRFRVTYVESGEMNEELGPDVSWLLQWR